jgi:hypothetical protein
LPHNAKSAPNSEQRPGNPTQNILAMDDKYKEDRITDHAEISKNFCCESEVAHASDGKRRRGEGGKHRPKDKNSKNDDRARRR